MGKLIVSPGAVKSNQEKIGKLHKDVAYTAVKSGNSWMLLSGQNAAVGEYVILNGELGKVTGSNAITGGSTAIVSGTNWTKLGNDGAMGVVKSLNDQIAQKIDTAGTGLSKSGTTLSISNSGVTAGSYGPSTNATPGYGATFNVPYITVNAQGKVTAASTKTVQIPASDNTNTWRGIQNNLTSTSTSDSLSAAQGKALNDKITNLFKSTTQDIRTSATGTFSVTKPSGANYILYVTTNISSTYYCVRYSETSYGVFYYEAPHTPAANMNIVATIVYV